MQEHEYKARDKTVQKMSRDGLREKNLRSKKEKRITGREADEKKIAGHREQELDFGKVRKTHTAEETVEGVKEGKHRLQSRHAFLEQEELAEAEEMENSEMSDDKAGGENLRLFHVPDFVKRVSGDIRDVMLKHRNRTGRAERKRWS